MSAFSVACLSFVLMVAFVASWIGMIQRVQIGRGRGLLLLLAAGSIVTALLAFAQGPGWFAGLLAGSSLAVSSVFVVLSRFSGQSHQTPAVAVGQPIPTFSAPDENGDEFDLASLRGRPILLKFFRGHW